MSAWKSFQTCKCEFVNLPGVFCNVQYLFFIVLYFIAATIMTVEFENIKYIKRSKHGLSEIIR
jgi:hypothetical protein